MIFLLNTTVHQSFQSNKFSVMWSTTNNVNHLECHIKIKTEVSYWEKWWIKLFWIIWKWNIENNFEKWNLRVFFLQEWSRHEIKWSFFYFLKFVKGLYCGLRCRYVERVFSKYGSWLYFAENTYLQSSPDKCWRIKPENCLPWFIHAKNVTFNFSRFPLL